MMSNLSNLSKAGPERPIYRLLLRDVGTVNTRGYSHPAPRRLAGLLKAALRQYGLRAIEVVEVGNDGKAKE